MKVSPKHRGAGDEPSIFARRFVLSRLAGFEKDMRICLVFV